MILLTVVKAEEIERAIRGLQSNKSADGHGLNVEHLKNAGVCIPILLTKLFNSCFVHSFVPDDFAASIIVPVPKGDFCKLNIN